MHAVTICSLTRVMQVTPRSGWSSDLERSNGLNALPARTCGVLAGGCSCDSAAERDGNTGARGCPSQAVAARSQAASSFRRLASFHACRRAVRIHRLCARSTGARPESSTAVTSAFRRSRTEVTCSWLCCAFNSWHQQISDDNVGDCMARPHAIWAVMRPIRLLTPASLARNV